MNRPTRTAAVTATLVLGLLTACGENPAPVGSPPAGPAATVAASSAAPTGPADAEPQQTEAGSAAIACAPGGSAKAGKVEVDGRTISGVAPRLGFPAGSKVKDAAGSKAAATVTLSAPEPELVLEHYREQGPKCGYTIVNNEGAVLYLTGQGWGVQVITQRTDSTVSFLSAPEQPQG